MKTRGVLLVAALFSSVAAAQHEYDERVYIYTTGDLSIEGAEEACDEGLALIASKWGVTGLNYNVAVKAKMYSVDTNVNNGKLKNERVKEIGELLTCQDWQTHVPETNLVPVYYEITVGGRKYRAEGAMVSPIFPELPGGGQVHSPPGYYPQGIYLSDVGAAILPNAPGKRGGLLTVNAIHDFVQNPNDDFESKAVHVLRVTVPAKD